MHWSWCCLAEDPIAGTYRLRHLSETHENMDRDCLLGAARHVGHFRMWIEQEKGQPVRVEVRTACNGREWRRFARSLGLIAGDDMASRAPAPRELLTMFAVRAPSWGALDRGSSAKMRTVKMLFMRHRWGRERGRSSVLASTRLMHQPSLTSIIPRAGYQLDF
jgi:hypothetical protein